MNNTEFLKAETRDDYLVSEEMKKVWKVQLDLLSEFIAVCKEHSLRYWVYGGTLLGAVRHKGYIPWDDDIDVAMPREDYEILQKHPEWFTKPAELHLPDNKEYYYESWLRVHNVNTTCHYPCDHIEGGVQKQGIYIDIIPIENVKDIETERKKRRKIKLLNVMGHACFYNINPNILLRFISSANRILRIITPERLYKKINRLATKNTDEKSEYFGENITAIYSLERTIFKKSCFEKTITVPFEYMEVDIPADYDTVLKTMYGNYMAFPPKEKRGTWHSFVFIPDKPYKEYKG